MNLSGTTVRLATLPALILAAIASGCGMNRNYANNQIRQLPHSKVAIEYTVSEPAVTTASAESTGDAPIPPPANTDKKILAITYPHPNPKYARRYAEVTLRDAPKAGEEKADKLAKQLVTNPFRQRDAASASDAAKDDNVLRTAVNREDLEFLLRDLVADSFFDREQRQGDVDLRVTLGSRTVQKQWDQIKSFDDLAARVTNDNANRTQPRRPAGTARTAGAELLAPTLGIDEIEEDQTAASNGAAGAPSKF